MLTRNVTIVNKLGLHARPAALLTKTANLFDCRITIRKGDKTILSVMTLAAKCDTELTVTADGPGEAAAMESMVSLIESGFGEEE